MRFVSTSLVILLCYTAYGQISDSFSDNDLTSDPTWTGNIDEFIVDSGLLRLYNPDSAGTSYLSTGGVEAENIGYELFINLNFNPSGQNYCDFYLSSSNNDLTGQLQGYFLRLGGTEDEISLFRQDNHQTAAIKIIDGANRRIDLSEVKIHIMAVREDDGKWSLFSRLDGETEYSPEGNIVDNTYSPSGYSGISCTYTKTRSEKFYFDDFNIIQNPVVAVMSFEIDTIWSENPGSIIVQFNNTFDTISAAKPENYILDPGNLNPDSLIIVSNDRKVILYFNSLADNTEYQLGIYNVESRDGTKLDINTYFFTYLIPYQVKTGDIIINEVLGDPSPSIELPEAEYIELFNKTNYTIDISGYTLNENSIPTCIIYPNEFKLLCRKSDLILFENSENVCGMTNWDAINNDGELIYLADQDSILIDMCIYDPELINDSEKKNGGWSLERINPYLSCDHPDNWRVSENRQGGTPGEINSLYNDEQDTISPQLQYSRIHHDSLELIFTEPVIFRDNLSENIQITGFLCKTMFSNVWGNEITIVFDTQFIPGKIYEINLKGVLDCTGNIMNDTTYEFGPGRTPVFQELVVNEIMSDPVPSNGLPETEYLELYNTTNNILELMDCLLIIGDDSLKLPEFCLYPSNYLILCGSSRTSSMKDYPPVLGLKSFPAINNSDEVILLLDPMLNPIHYLKFSSGWYGSIDKDDGGYSLEMIDTRFPHRNDNWKATINDTGGTPGYQNSVSEDYVDLTGPKLVQAIPISPDSVVLEFDEMLHPYKVNNVIASIDPIVNISGILHKINHGNYLYLTFTVVLDRDTKYTIEIDGITDCAGNIIQNDFNSTSFLFPDDPEPGDILINEVLFHPRSGGIEFIEICNASEKHLDLKDWQFARYEGYKAIYSVLITSTNRVIPPDSYMALSKDPKLLKADFPFAPEINIISVNQLPLLPDDKGEIGLIMPDGRSSDYFEYMDSYHNGLLYDTRGVSLERIYIDHETNHPENWQSASYDTGYGTPGQKNSQSKGPISNFDELIIDPKVFIPDYGSSMQIVTINYQITDPGYNANIEVYDMEGRKVKIIAQNALLGTRGFFTWDGSNDQGMKSDSGHYIIFMEAWNLNGDIRQLKETVVVAPKF